LEEKVVYLLKVIQEQGIKKDSHNSHNPPSQDKFKPKRNQSLRKKTGRKSGGQLGHEGKTLEMVDTPDEVIDLKSDFCSCCGEDLSSSVFEFLSRRQEVVLPPINIKPIYREYRQYQSICTCGHHQKADFPSSISSSIQFGSDIITLVSYFNVFQYVPYARLELLFKDVFHLSISQGSIQNLLTKAAQKVNPFYETIFEEVKKARYVGSDETGAKVNGEKWWIWVWQNIHNTFIKATESRGFDTIEDTFPEGLPTACIGSDRWAAQLKTISKSKQLCFPHLLRELIFLEESEKNQWATQLKTLLKEGLQLRKQAVEKQKPFTKENLQTCQLENQLNQLLAQQIDKKKFKKTFTFQKSMIKHRNNLFTFLYDLEVPPDNNASERAIRNIKVKQKISGQFKSGQHNFCKLRSVMDTLRKRKLDVFFFLKAMLSAQLQKSPE
jgi:transposase